MAKNKDNQLIADNILTRICATIVKAENTTIKARLDDESLKQLQDSHAQWLGQESLVAPPDICIKAMAKAPPSNSNTRLTVVDVGIPSVLNTSSSTTSVTITAKKTHITS